MPGATNPLVSIVITLYNYKEYVLKCVSSCLGQTYDNVEVVVVDDASTDGGDKMVEQYVAKRFPGANFRLIRHRKNIGYVAAMNTGVLAARGEFIRQIDADDKLVPNAVWLAMKRFKQCPELALVHGRALKWWGGKKTDGLCKVYCHSSTRLWRRSVFDKFGLYYEPLVPADTELIFRLGIHPLSPLKRMVLDARIPEVVTYYRKHKRQMHSVKKRTSKDQDFSQRIEQLKREGITKENTRFP